MIELPHTIVGAAIAAKVGNPYLALPLALASHFVMDMVPHWNPHLNKEIAKYGKITTLTIWVLIVDVLLSLGAGLLIGSKFLPDTNKFLVVLACCFLAVLPDVAEAPYFFLNKEWRPMKKLVEFQSKIQFNVPFVPGVISQALVVIAALWWIYS